MKVLFADDDEGMRTLIEHVMESGGHEVACACDGQEALRLFDACCPDIVVLDVMMPQLNGYDVTRELRRRDVQVPVILLTAKGDIVDKSCGFGAGADDYLVKPFIPEELLLRMDALVRRARRAGEGRAPETVLAFDGLEVDFARQRVTVGGEPVALSSKEFQLLAILAGSPGKTFSQKRLTEEIWGAGYAGEVTGITVLVHRLRAKIERDPSNPRFVQTVWHAGYRFGDAR